MANKTNEKYMADLAIKKIAPYFYKINYNDLDYTIGSDYYEKYHNNIGACSAIRNGNYFGRNYDWYYDECATFMVNCKATKHRHGSIGVVGGNPNLTDEIVNGGKYNAAYKILPFQMLDGINDCGVIAEINVAPTGDRGYTIGTNPDGQDMCALMLVRYILDYANSATHAIDLIKELNIFCPISEERKQEVHWMIADKEKTYVVEIINNELQVIETFVGNKPIMTNFYLYGFDGNTSTAFYKSNTYDPLETTLSKYAAGLERFDILSDGYTDSDNKRGMINLMKSVRYSKAYSNDTNPYWYSEFVGNLESLGYGDLTIDSTVSDFQPLKNHLIELYPYRQRDGKFWQTVHASVYDVEQCALWVIVQEGNEEYKFNLEKGTVRDETHTYVQEIIDSFESTFADKTVLPRELELYWFRKAVARYSTELKPITFNEDEMWFDTKIDQYIIDTLAAFMKQMYQEREVSRVNKQVSIVTKDLSINSGGHSQVAVREELAYCESQSIQMVSNQKPTAYN